MHRRDKNNIQGGRADGRTATFLYPGIVSPRNAREMEAAVPFIDSSTHSKALVFIQPRKEVGMLQIQT